MEELHEIIDEYWNDYVSKRDLPGVFENSIPIIWFGDIDAYFRSKIKTVTVGLNPSFSEFMNNKNENDLSFRFKGAEAFVAKNNLDKEEKNKLISMYNAYFSEEPYYKWFKYYDSKVMGFVSEYGYDVGYNTKYDPKKHTNTAIHIDCYSALATKPVWSAMKIEEKYKSTLSTLPNIKLFMRFLDYLDPDVILFSSSYEAFRECMKILGGKEKLIPDISQVEDYPVHKGLINSFIIKDKLVIHGRYKSTPFSAISDDLKRSVFEQIFKTYSLVEDSEGNKKWVKN